MKHEPIEQHIEEEFHVSWYIIAYKFIFGLAEAVLGIGIAFFGKTAIIWYRAYSRAELSEEPHSLLVRLTRGIIPTVLAHHTFLVFYLLLLGLTKIAGAIGLMYKQNWGVDLLVALTIIMFPFQCIQLVTHPSIADFLYIFIGLFIALYLVNFKPRQWTRRVVKRIRRV